MRSWLLWICVCLVGCQPSGADARRMWTRVHGHADQEIQRDELYQRLLAYDLLVESYISAVQQNQPRNKAMDDLFALYATTLDPYFEELTFASDTFEQWLTHVYTEQQLDVLREHHLFSLEQPLMLYHINGLAMLLANDKITVDQLVGSLFPEMDAFDGQRWERLNQELERLLRTATQGNNRI